MHSHSLRVCDRVHGEITLPAVAVRIAETAEFHRLDGIRQLGGGSLVSPSASRTRREHALGVCHLAGEMGRHLQRLTTSTSAERVTNDDVLCLQLAGLVHDLGHGPFSHLFEDFMASRRRASGAEPWSHEEMGMRVFDLLLDRHDIRLGDYFATSYTACHVAFIRLLVRGLYLDEPWPEATGRPATKRFLVDIVSNKQCGIDVDKLDYLARDALSVFGASRPFDARRILHAAAPRDVGDGRTVLAFDERVAFELGDVFTLRAKLHRQVYQHRAVKVVERLLVRILEALDDARGGEVAASATDAAAFAQLTDATVLGMVANAPAASALHAQLFSPPQHRRLHVAVRVHTAPLCGECAKETEVSHAFCAACGASTREREFVYRADGLRQSPACLLDSALATEQVRERLPPGERAAPLEVHLIDVHCGTLVARSDPWHADAKWATFDALAGIHFFSDDDATDCTWRGMCPAALHAPRSTHVRTAYCYVEARAGEARLRAVSEAFAAWGAGIGEVMGTPA